MLLSNGLGVGAPIVKVNSKSRMKKIANSACMFATFVFVILFGSSLALAQIPATPRPSPTPPPRPVDGTVKNSQDDPGPMTTFEEEIRAKRAIKTAEKDHQANLKRATDIAQLGKELEQTLKNKPSLDRDTLKKVEKLEKLTKKVRSEAGGEDEDVTIIKKPDDISSTATRIAEASETLCKNVHDTPRQVVSASVIGNANVLLELLKMLRSFSAQP
jgi:hypothetical protein